MGKSNKVVIKAVDRKEFPSQKSLSEASFLEGRYIGTVTSENELDSFLKGNYVESTKLTFWDQNRIQISQKQAVEVLLLNYI